MPDFLPLAVMDDELAISYRNRLCRVNDWGDTAPTVQQMASKMGGGFRVAAVLESAKLLAWVSGKPIEEFVRNHTMLPLQRAVISSTQRPEREYAHDVLLLQKRANCATRSHLYFCPDCVANDWSENGSPYWRRRHQIPGLYCCQVHHRPLRYIPHPRSSVCLPCDVLDASQEVDLQRLFLAKENPYVLKFTEICSAMLGLEKPVRDFQLHKTLKRRVFHLRETKRDGSPPLKSGMLNAMYSKDWLQDVFTRTSKDPIGATGYIEKVLEKFTSGVNGVGYALLFAGLYATSSDAYNALAQSGAEETDHGISSVDCIPNESIRNHFATSR